MKICILLLITMSTLFAEDIIIDDYNFTWNVDSVGGYQYVISVTEDFTNIRAYGSDRTSISLTMPQAKWLAEKLSKVKEFQEKINTTGENIVEENGDQLILFSKTDEGFHTMFRDGKGGTVISFTRGEARKAARLLNKLPAQVKELRKRLDKILD